jgi:Transposase DDE domain group 1
VPEQGTYSVNFLDLRHFSNSPLRLSTAFSPSNVVATANQESRQSRQRPHEARGRTDTNITDNMRSGRDQRPRGRFNGNRPFNPQPVYETLYCARGQAENLIKLHKAQLASDRTSCRSPLANQMRLILHTAAYWLTLTVRDTIPATHALAPAEFATIRLRLLKLGTRVIETASRVRLAFAAACPDAALFRHIAAALMPTGP